jgi:hypothetical protein
MAAAAKRLCSLVHARAPWNGSEKVYVCGKLDKLRSDPKVYEAAKLKGNYEAAQQIVKKMINDHVLDRMVDDITPHIHRKRELLVTVPHPPFDDGNGIGAGLERRVSVRNALPFQFGGEIAEQLGATLDTGIVQIGRVGRTKLKPFERFLYQPIYDGVVRTDAAYLLADDVCTLGSTLASLRSHIVAKGGTVCSFGVLASGAGQWVPLAISGKTCQLLEELFGSSLSPFWIEEIGHDTVCLTEAEGSTLARWGEARSERGTALVQRLRDRLAEIASSGMC